MKRKALGNTGETVPEIGLGTWRYGGGSGPLRSGIALGADLIDTAERYGTEDAVGEAIKFGNALRGLMRGVVLGPLGIAADIREKDPGVDVFDTKRRRFDAPLAEVRDFL